LPWPARIFGVVPHQNKRGVLEVDYLKKKKKGGGGGGGGIM